MLVATSLLRTNLLYLDRFLLLVLLISRPGLQAVRVLLGLGLRGGHLPQATLSYPTYQLVGSTSVGLPNMTRSVLKLLTNTPSRYRCT